MDVSATWHLEDANRLLDAGGERFLEAWGDAVDEKARATVHVDTGRLQGTIGHEVEGDTVTAYMGDDTTPYALAEEYGIPGRAANPAFTRAVIEMQGRAEEVARGAFRE
jgi:hypothetical protein